MQIIVLHLFCAPASSYGPASSSNAVLKICRQNRISAAKTFEASPGTFPSTFPYIASILKSGRGLSSFCFDRSPSRGGESVAARKFWEKADQSDIKSETSAIHANVPGKCIDEGCRPCWRPDGRQAEFALREPVSSARTLWCANISAKSPFACIFIGTPLASPALRDVGSPPGTA